jgi:hypothetical protein
MTTLLRGSVEQRHSHGAESLQAGRKYFRVIWDEGNLRNCSASKNFLQSVKINETKPINFKVKMRHVVAQCV